MAARGTTIAVRPLEIKHLFDFAIRLYRFNFVPMFLALAIVQLPVTLLMLPMIKTLEPFITDMQNMSYTGEQPGAAMWADMADFGLIVIVTLLSVGIYHLFIMPLGNLTCARLAVQAMHGVRESFSEAFNFALTRYWATQVALATYFLPVVIAALFMMLIVLAINAIGSESGVIGSAVFAFIVIIVGSIATSFMWVRFFPALMGIVQTTEEPEGEGMLAHGLYYLKRSWGLTQGYYLRCFGLIVVISFVVGFINQGLADSVNLIILIVQLLAEGGNFGEQLIAMTGPEQANSVNPVSFILTMLFALVLPPLSICYMLLMYYDLRCRKEAYDLKLVLGMEQD